MHNSAIRLHPQAQGLLFSQILLFSKIFNDVLGQLETDYVSIALLTTNSELLLFSSSPGYEWSLIENQQWQYKKRFQSNFFFQDQYQVWDGHEHLMEYAFSLSVPSSFEDYRVVYTFATHAQDKDNHVMLLNNIARLTRMGQFCLKAILNELPFLTRKSEKHPKPQLQLVVNNLQSHQEDNP